MSTKARRSSRLASAAAWTACPSPSAITNRASSMGSLPGTTATDMTAAYGIGRPVEGGARNVVRLAVLGPDGPTGTFTDEFGELGW